MTLVIDVHVIGLLCRVDMTISVGTDGSGGGGGPVISVELVVDR